MTFRRRTFAIPAAVLLALSFVVPVAPQQSGEPARQASGGGLERRLAPLVNGDIARSSTASIEIVDLETGRVVAARNPNLPVAPASNMKLFTTAAALDLLGPRFEIVTTVAARGEVDPTGRLRGDVTVIGRGDPTIGSRFHDGNATAIIDEWATALKEQGIQTIGGNLYFDHGYFDGEFVHPTWPEDQLVNWYEAPISALAMQEGCVMVRVLPGRSGGRCVVQLEPQTDFVTIENTCRTAGGRGAFIGRKPGTNSIIVRGNVPPRSGATEVYVTVQYPVRYFANVAHRAFERNGIRVEGEVLVVPRTPEGEWRTIAEHRTPITLVNFVINKRSQNHYAEQLLKIVGAEKRQEGSWAASTAVVEEWMANRVGVPPAQFDMVDGSGMSRFNRASANAFIQLLRYMWNTPYRREFVSSMPYSGEPDSRLRRRLNEADYERQVYAKTGYISGVIGLSGYVHARSGKVYAFSFLFNRYRTGVWGVYRLQDEMLKQIIDHG